MAMTDLTEPLTAVRESRQALTTVISAVENTPEESLAAPSLLPGWTRGHVVAHLALNAEGLAGVLHGAHVGDPHPRSGARSVAAGQRYLEVQLPQPIRVPDPAQRQPVGQLPERGVVHRHQRRGELVGVDPHRPPRLVDPHLRGQLGGQVRGERIGGLQHRVHQRSECGAAGQVRHR